MMHGELIKDKIVVEKNREAARLYSKSKIGKLIEEKNIYLDLIEGLYLLEKDKLEVFYKKEKIGFQHLFEVAAREVSDFEIKYITFRDLRKRGYIVKPYNRRKNITFQVEQKTKSPIFVSTFSERDFLDFKETIEILDFIRDKDAFLWFAIVDEEGDVTYYRISRLDIKGEMKKHDFNKTKGILLKNRVLIFDKVVSKELFDEEFFGKPFNDGLQLSLVEALYLTENNLIDIYYPNGRKISKNDVRKVFKDLQPDIDYRLPVFKDLKERKMIVKTGFKFGTHFRVYTSNPNETHAEYLVHVVDKNFRSVWSEISRAVRLAHSVNKEIVFAVVNDEIDYISFGRLRP